MRKALVYIALALSALFWGTSYVMTKELFLKEASLTVPILITLRLVVVVVLFVPLLLCLGKLTKIRKGDLKWFLLLAAIEPFIHSLFETAGVKLTSSSLSSIMIATAPVFIPFLMAALYKERVRGNHVLGIVLSVLGIGVMLMGGDSALWGSVWGIVCLLGAVIMSMTYTLLVAKIVDGYDALSVTIYQNLFGLIYYFPVMLLTSADALPRLSWSAEMLLLIVGLGVFCSMLAYVFYNYGVQKAGASKACVFVNGIPVVTMLTAVAIGQESISVWKILGMVVVILGIFLAQRRCEDEVR